MKRRQKRRIALLVILVLMLSLLGLWYWNFKATKSLSIDLTVPASDTVAPPTYLYSFAAGGGQHLASPIGILVDNGNVYVSDSEQGVIFEFKENGAFVRTFGKGKLQTPLYIAKSPKTGNLYVADRRLRKMLIFTPNGDYVGEFDPKLPKAQLPKFDTKGDVWLPIAMDFAPDGSLYVIELLNGQRLLIFGPDGAFKKSVGSIGQTSKATDLPGRFYFPNSVKVHKNEVWVVDSNNRRIQIFDLAGEYKRLLPVSGLPRGMAFLPPGSAVSTSAVDNLVVVDTLSHDATIWSSNGDKLLSFGERGVLEGQFSFPGDVSIGQKSVMFLTDTLNRRVQAWGWPQNVSPLPKILPRQPAWCLALLPLLLIPLLFRKKKFHATADFVHGMLAAELVSQMPDRRRSWWVSQEDYDALRELSQGDIRLSELLQPAEYSETDAAALAERLEIDLGQAAILTAARRAKVFCTEDAELRKLAKLLELDVVDRTEYLQRFGTAQVGADPDAEE